MIDSHRDEIAKLESLYAMNPEGRVFTHLAEACRKAGQLERAQQILEDGLQKHPDYASAHVVLGRVLADSGEDVKAAVEFRRVLELDRHNLVALRSLGELAVRAGQPEEALHYYSELAVLDPADPEIQEQLRTLGKATAEESAAEAAGGTSDAASHGPASSETPDQADAGAAGVEATDAGEAVDAGVHAGASADESGPDGWVDDAATEAAGEDSAEQDGLEIEAHAFTEEPDGSGYAPLEGLESTDVEGSAEAVWPEDAPIEIPSWPEAVTDAGTADAPVLPGEHPPIDEAAWRDIGVGAIGSDDPVESAGESDAAGSRDGAEEEGAPVSDAPEGASGTEPSVGAAERIDPDHLRFAPPGLYGRPVDDDVAAAPVVGSTDDESSVPDETGDGTEREMEGRWQEPESLPADEQAERSRPADHTAEWIPADRWGWVAASAGSSGSDAAADDDLEPAEQEAEPEAESLSEPAAAWESESVSFDAETSFAGLMAETEADEDDATAGEAGSDEAFEEESTAAVLEAFIESGEDEEGDDVAFEIELESEAIEAEPASPSPGAVDAAGPSSVSWVTDGEDEGEQVITETLAEIYASQGLFDRATAVYRRLIESHPEDDRLRARLADLESATGWAEEDEAGPPDEEREAFLERVEAAWTGGEGAAGTGESPYAWSEEAGAEAESGPPVADYFAALLAWRPSEAVPFPESYGTEPAEASPVEDWYAEEAERTAEDVEPDEAGREGEEDLEMFRSWLKSLKK